MRCRLLIGRIKLFNGVAFRDDTCHPICLGSIFGFVFATCAVGSSSDTARPTTICDLRLMSTKYILSTLLMEVGAAQARFMSETYETIEARSLFEKSEANRDHRRRCRERGVKSSRAMQ